MTCLDLTKRRDVMLGWVDDHNGPHVVEQEDVSYCKPRLLPRPFRKYLQIWSVFNILGILTFLAAAFTNDVPFPEKQTGGYHEPTA